MVCRFNVNAHVKVLFSSSSRNWKVGDFGLTTEGSSRHTRTSVFARGTASYRAPELVNDDPVFSNKVDIFAIGCILFELVSGGRKAFANDIAVHEFRISHSQLEIPFAAIDERWQHDLEQEIRRMLSVDRTDRPSAVVLRHKFARNRNVSLGYRWMEKNDYRNAAEAFNLAMEEYSVHPSVLSQLGDCYYRIGDYANAIQSYQSSILNGSPPSALLLPRLVNAQHANGDFADAIDTYKQLIKDDPNNVRLFTRLCDAYISSQRYKDVISTFREAPRKCRTDSALLEKLGDAEGYMEKAVKAYADAIKSAPVVTSSLRQALQKAKDAKSNECSTKREFPVKLYGWGPGAHKKPAPPALSIVTVPVPKASQTHESVPQVGPEPMPTISSGVSSSVTRKPRVTKLKSPSGSRALSGAFNESANSSPFTPSSSIDSASTADRLTLTATPMQQDTSGQISGFFDEYSQSQITSGTLVAALSSYIPQRTDQMQVEYGDVVAVKEIYDDGWAAAVKLDENIWEQSSPIRLPPSWKDLFASGGNSPLSPVVDRTNSGTFEDRPALETFLIDLSRFCLADVWTAV